MSKFLTTTPNDYVKECGLSGRTPVIQVYDCNGNFFLCDEDWNFLRTKSYSSRDLAILAGNHYTSSFQKRKAA